MKLRWNQLGGQVGVGLAVLGFVLLFLGWNGAASYDRVPAQFPYLISGGLAGLALVVLGGSLLIVQNARQDRAELQAAVEDLRDAVEKLRFGGASGGSAMNAAALEAEGLVVGGPSSYHRPTCRLVEGRTNLAAMTVADAQAAGLAACRACDPQDLALAATEPAGASRRRRRS